MKLKDLLFFSHRIMDDADISHALIGGFALAALGYQRATNDIDYLVHGQDQIIIEKIFLTSGFTIFHKTNEVIQFQGLGPIDILFAHRELSQEMLIRASKQLFMGIPYVESSDIIGLKIQAYINNPSRELAELADIFSLLKISHSVDKSRVMKYAELFGEQDKISLLIKKAHHDDYHAS